MPDSPRLKVVRVKVTGHKGCEIYFENGLNIIRGRNSLGKTTALRLIHYGLGGSGENFIKEIADCEYLLLDVELNGQSFRIRRHLQKQSARIRVFPVGEYGINKHFYFDYQLGGEFSEFLLRSLGMPINEIPRGGRQAGETRLVSFLEMFRLMYVSQDLGYVGIQAGQRYERMETAVFETLLDLSAARLFDLEVEKSKLEAQKDEVEAEIRHARQLMQELDIPTEDRINQRITELKNLKDEKTRELQELKQQLKGTPQWALDLREEILEIDRAVQLSTEEITFLTQKLEEYRLSRNDALNEQRRLQRLDSSKRVLSSFTFSQCPRCSQSITDEMRAREEHDHCMLCGRGLMQEPMPQYDIVKATSDLKDEVEELNQLIERYELSIKTAASRREKLLREKESKESELDERMGEHYTTAFVANVEATSSQVGSLVEKISQQQNFLDIWRRLDERYEILSQVESRIQEVENKLDALKQIKEQDKKKIDVFGDYFHNFIKEVFRDYKYSRINEDSYKPVINNHEYTGFSAVQKDAAILAYHYALLRYSLDHNSNYPRFLMIDTPNKDDMDPDLYTRIMHQFAALKQQEEPFQLIIATRGVPQSLEDDVILSLEEDYLLREIQLSLF
jgi:hypothetical protein